MSVLTSMRPSGLAPRRITAGLRRLFARVRDGSEESRREQHHRDQAWYGDE